jgi:hypothetical protein
MISTIVTKFDSIMTSMTVHYKQLTGAYSMTFWSLIKVFQLHQAMLITCPAFLADRYILVRSICSLVIPGVVLLSSFKNDEQWYQPTLCVCSYNSSNLLSITWLYGFRSLTPFRACNDYTGADDAHLEATLVKVVHVVVRDVILGSHVRHKPKPVLDDLWIFVQGSLVVIPLIDT